MRWGRAEATRRAASSHAPRRPRVGLASPAGQPRSWIGRIRNRKPMASRSLRALLVRLADPIRCGRYLSWSEGIHATRSEEDDEEAEGPRADDPGGRGRVRRP